MSRRVLVTGATGCVGRAVVHAAIAAGWQVRGLARRAPPIAVDGLELARGDVRDAATVRGAIDGCQAVVHLASWVHRVPRGEPDLAELRRSVVDGARVVAAAASAGGASLIHASTVAVYGQSPGGISDESTAPCPETPYARAKLESEDAVLQADGAASVLRLAVVYGPHDRGNFVALMRGVDAGYACVVGAGANRKSVVYVENLADRILLLLEKGRPGVWVVADEPAPTQAEILDALALALGRRRPPRLPALPLRALARAVDTLAAVRGGADRPTWRSRVSKLAESTHYCGEALDRALAYRPRVPLAEGFRRMAAWYLAEVARG